MNLKIIKGNLKPHIGKHWMLHCIWYRFDMQKLAEIMIRYHKCISLLLWYCICIPKGWYAPESISRNIFELIFVEIEFDQVGEVTQCVSVKFVNVTIYQSYLLQMYQMVRWEHITHKNWHRANRHLENLQRLIKSTSKIDSLYDWNRLFNDTHLINSGDKNNHFDSNLFM